MGVNKKKLLFYILPLTLVFMVGCNKKDVDSLRKNVEISNRRIETIMKDYKTSKFKAIKFYDSVKQCIEDKGDIVIDSNLDKTLKDVLIDTVNDYKTILKTSYEEEKLIADERNVSFPTFNEYMKDIITSNYYLNEQRGVLEQDIMFRLPYGKIIGLEVEWLGGVIIAVQTYTNE